MTSYYMLLTEDAADVGDIISNIGPDGVPNPVVREPRAVPIADTLHHRASDRLVEILHASTPRVRVATVIPEGDVRPHRGIWVESDTDASLDDKPVAEGDIELEAHGGWRIHTIEPLRTILGPQADLILAAVTEIGIPAFEHAADTFSGAVAAYHAQTEQLHRQPGTRAVRKAQCGAAIALDTVGADSFWWVNTIGCTWGTEILALAARDLLGTVDGWNTRAYNLLTSAWRHAFARPLHPHDTPTSRITVAAGGDPR